MTRDPHVGIRGAAPDSGEIRRFSEPESRFARREVRVLLDTHALLWWLLDSDRLSGTARRIIGTGSNTLLWSAAGSREISIGFGLGRLELPGGSGEFPAEQMRVQRVEPLSISHAHAWAVTDLPRHHRDPFDRMLVAQARTEDLPILNANPAIRLSDVRTVW